MAADLSERRNISPKQRNDGRVSALSANFEHGSSTSLYSLPLVEQTQPSRDLTVVRPCFFLLQLLGMWKPEEDRSQVIWKMYRSFVYLVWLTGLVGIMALDFVHYGFRDRLIHWGAIMNSVPTCLNLLCPLLFARYYFRRGQFLGLVSSVQGISENHHRKLQKIAHVYTMVSVTLWILGATFFIFHWTPFFSVRWHYIVYIPVILYSTGWWAVWLSIYGFVCHVHTLQIQDVMGSVSSKDCSSTIALLKHQRLQNSIDRTQKDFNVIISFALAYHTVDVIIFSFAYFDVAFGSHYKLWQYVGGISFVLTSILLKLCPPALVSATIHRMVVQAAKRCQMNVTPLSLNLPLEDMALFQYMASLESQMGLKILGICITVELVGQILMTVLTAVVSFVAFIVPRLK